MKRLLIGALVAVATSALMAQDASELALTQAPFRVYMTGEVVRRALAGRGITYEPYLYKTGLFDRAWPQFKPPIETHWRAFVNGEMSREDAIRQVVASIR
ncbi:MAG TPA: hypothetical protein VIX63_18445 [Vicinamibacterales bacterium]